MDKNWMVRKLKMMLKFTTEDEHTKKLAKELINNRNDQKVYHIVRAKTAHPLNTEDDEYLQMQLRRYRVEERKQQFTEAIHSLVLKEALSQPLAKQKIKTLDENEWLLADKDGIAKMEDKLGVTLLNKGANLISTKYQTIANIIAHKQQTTNNQ